MKTFFLILFILFTIVSCNRNIDKNNHELVETNYLAIFNERNIDSPEISYPIEHYEKQIIEFQRLIPERRRINTIHNVNNVIPGFLCFIVGFDDFNAGRGEGFDIIANTSPRGNIFGLYTFDKYHKIVDEYQVGFRNYLDSIRNVLFEKIPGNKFEYGLISLGDFNNDGINEIASIFSYPPYHDYVFAVFGYDVIQNAFVEKLLVPIYIHFEQPYPPIEHLGDGFKILELLEYTPLELTWNNYLWDMATLRYIKKQ